MQFLRYTKKFVVYLSFKFSWVFCILSGNPKLEAWQQKLLWLPQEIHRRASNKISNWTPMSGQSWSSQRRPSLLLYPCSFPFPSFPHPLIKSLASAWEIEEGRVPGGQDLTCSFPPLQASELAGSPQKIPACVTVSCDLLKKEKNSYIKLSQKKKQDRKLYM